MRVTVYCDGNVVVTAPEGSGLGVVERFIADKKRWILKKIEQFKSACIVPVCKGSIEEYKKHKAGALKLVTERIDHFSRVYGFSLNRVSIRNQKTRWGSCSSRGNININYKILFLPKEMQDYIIVHELCHLKEMNHSKRFWDLVSQTFPNYRELRKQLRGIRRI